MNSIKRFILTKSRTMDERRYTPELVVSENLTFSIPLYQRLFAWGEKQVLGLMNDLHEHFEQGDSPYYLGMLSCIANKGHYDLIDGQQRFTIMTLMGIVLRDYCPSWNAFIDGGKRVSFIARTKDKEYLASKIGGDSATPEPNIKMESAINVIKDYMADPEVFKSDEERKIYAERAFKYLSFYFSILPNEYLNEPTSLNKYFEAMNAHGKSLEQHEILKVELMRGEKEKEELTRIWNAVSELDHPIIKRHYDDEPIDSYRQSFREAIYLCRNGEYERAFQYCITSYDNENNDTIGAIEAKKPEPAVPLNLGEVNERSIISFPDFLLLVLDINLGLGGKYAFYRKDLLTAFKENAIQDKKHFYYDMLYCRLLLDYYIITKEDGKYGNKYEILYKDGSDYENPLPKKSVIQYQSMLYVSQTPIYEWLKPLLVQLMTREPENCTELLNWLKNNDDEYRQLPKDVEEMSYRNRVDRYWFWRLDYYLWERKDEYFKNVEEREIVDEYVFRANRSIEHLHPQHQDNNVEWDENEVHTFGNLAMISQSFNSEQSDDPVTVKFARILDQANNHNLQSIKMYKMYLDAEKTPGGWTADKMHKHQKEMFELLKNSYVR